MFLYSLLTTIYQFFWSSTFEVVGVSQKQNITMIVFLINNLFTTQQKMHQKAIKIYIKAQEVFHS